MSVESVIDLLVSRGLIDSNQREDYIKAVKESGMEPTEAIQQMGVIDREQFFQLVANDIGGNFYDLTTYDPTPQMLATIPQGMAKLYNGIPIQILANGLEVAFIDPLNPQNVEELGFAINQTIIPAVAPPEQITELIERCYNTGLVDNDSNLDVGKMMQVELESLSAQVDDETDSAPIIRYVDLVLFQAIKEKASDIHFEPFDGDFKIRYRVDGALYEMAPPPEHLKNAIISRIKVMSGLNIAESRLPQDGRISQEVHGQQIDLRVSTLPTAHGESVVLRVLDRNSAKLELEALNLPTYIYDYIKDTIKKPNGIFICTGPTGAGKTTTLYACLRKINTLDTKLLTAEDPVEYEIDGIIQVPVKESIGLTFEKVLRAFLRQDPDRILVGEMRDLETAQIAIQASLTGHLVLSTLHTNDAPGAVTRLVDMGCEPFLVSATLEGVLGQRLLRKICPDCRVAYNPSEAVLEQIGLTRHDIGGKEFHTGQGCSTCNDTGYRGRQGLFELLDMNDPLRELISQRAATVVLKAKARELGMKTLREDGLRNIYDGVTTIEEVLKYT